MQCERRHGPGLAVDRQAHQARRGRASPDRTRRLHRRPSAGGQRAPRGHRPLAARPRAHPRLRRRGDAGHAGRGRRDHGRGRGESVQAIWRGGDGADSLLSVGDRQGAVRRRARGGRRRPRPLHRRGRRRPPRRPLRAAARGRRSREGAGARRADPPRSGRHQPRGTPAARLRRSRSRLRRGRGRHSRALPLPEVRLDADRDLRRDRALGRPRRRADDLVQLHGAVHHAPAGEPRARRAGEQAALHRAARHRRLLRHQVEHLPVSRAHRPRRHEDRRAGEVDRGSARAPDGLVERNGPRGLARSGRA